MNRSKMAHLFHGCAILAACSEATSGEGATALDNDALQVGESAVDDEAALRGAYDFLRHYGYFPDAELAARYPGWSPLLDAGPDDPELFAGVMEEALSLYQLAHGLPATGLLDAETREAMQRPRCPFPDYYGADTTITAASTGSGAPGARYGSGIVGLDDLTNPLDPSEYTFTGGTWPSLDLTYGFANYTADVTWAYQRTAVAAAMNTWSLAAPIKWVERAQPEVSIGFYPLKHGDGNDFTNELAHAFPPCTLPFGWFACAPQAPFAGDVHFDDKTYHWANGNGQSYDIESVALHELGHVLGLGHSANSKAVMYPFVQDGLRTLSADDIDGIRALYPAYRDPRTFDWFWYYALNPDLLTVYQGDKLAVSFHWLTYGRSEGRRASPAFDPKYYLAKHPDVANHYGATNYEGAIWHFRDAGLQEGRQTSPAFDVKYYLDYYPDLKAAYGSNHGAALVHWLYTGILEGRRGSAEFDPVYYLQTYPTIAQEVGPTNYGGALRHWLLMGIKFGLKGAP